MSLDVKLKLAVSLTHLAVFALPYKVRLASAAAQLIRLLYGGVSSKSTVIYIYIPKRNRVGGNGMEQILTKRLTEIGFECVSRQDVHWTVKVYQKGFASSSLGRKFVTLPVAVMLRG